MNSLFFVVGSTVLVSILGLFLRLTLSYTKQLWASTFQQTIVFAILPVITFVITKVIAGDIALALGMVGALSIVRFRNPVKNTLELVIYFALITIGISSAINLKYAVALTIFIIIILILFNYLRKIKTNKNTELFTLSYHEGEMMCSLEINTNSPIDNKFRNYLLKEEIIDKKNNKYFYRFISRDREEIESLRKQLFDLGIENININYL